MSDQLERLVGRAMMDAGFRNQLVDNPAAAAKAAGFELSDDELRRVTNALSSETGKRIISELNQPGTEAVW